MTRGRKATNSAQLRAPTRIREAAPRTSTPASTTVSSSKGISGRHASIICSAPVHRGHPRSPRRADPSPSTGRSSPRGRCLRHARLRAGRCGPRSGPARPRGERPSAFILLPVAYIKPSPDALGRTSEPFRDDGPAWTADRPRPLARSHGRGRWAKRCFARGAAPVTNGPGPLPDHAPGGRRRTGAGPGALDATPRHARCRSAPPRARLEDSPAAPRRTANTRARRRARRSADATPPFDVHRPSMVYTRSMPARACTGGFRFGRKGRQRLCAVV